MTAIYASFVFISFEIYYTIPSYFSTFAIQECGLIYTVSSVTFVIGSYITLFSLSLINNFVTFNRLSAYYPRTPDYTLCSGVHVCWSEHSDSSFVYGFMILDYGFGTMTATTYHSMAKSQS